MRLKLISRVEQAGVTGLQLTFIQAPDPENTSSAQGIQLSGWVDSAYAMTFEVGREYDLSFTAV